MRCKRCGFVGAEWRVDGKTRWRGWAGETDTQSEIERCGCGVRSDQRCGRALLDRTHMKSTESDFASRTPSCSVARGWARQMRCAASLVP